MSDFFRHVRILFLAIFIAVGVMSYATESLGNFAVIAGFALTLLTLFWFITWAVAPKKAPKPLTCVTDTVSHQLPIRPDESGSQLSTDVNEALPDSDGPGISALPEHVSEDDDSNPVADFESVPEVRGLIWLLLSPRGRIGRLGFFGGILLADVVCFSVLLAPSYLVRFLSEETVNRIELIYALTFLVCAALVTTKRWHDLGNPGYVSLLLFVPIIQLVALFSLFLGQGNSRENRFGRRSVSIRIAPASIALLVFLAIVRVAGIHLGDSMTSADALFEEGQRQFERDDYERAANTYVRAYHSLDEPAELYPFLPEIQLNRSVAATSAAESYILNGEGREAQEWIGVALPIAAALENSYPNDESLNNITLDVVRLYDSALEVSDEPDPDVLQPVLRWFNEAIASSPDDIDLLTSLGILQLGLEEYSDALATFDQAITADEDLFARRGDSIPIQSRLGGNYHNRAMANASLGNLAAARSDYLIALEHQSVAFAAQPDVPHHREFLRNHHVNLGLLLVGTGKPQEALTHFEDGLELMPDDPDIKHWIADALTQMDRFEEAVPLLEDVIAADDSKVDAVLLLAYTCTMLERYDDALQILEPLRNRRSPVPDAHFHAGMAEFHRKGYPAAAEAFERALDLDLSNRAWALFHLALCYTQLDRADDAANTHDRLEQIDAELAETLRGYLSAPAQPPPPINVFTI